MSLHRAYRIKTDYPVIGVKLIHRARRFMAEIGNFELKPVLGFSRLRKELECFGYIPERTILKISGCPNLPASGKFLR
jgi:hypothetical protein